MSPKYLLPSLPTYHVDIDNKILLLQIQNSVWMEASSSTLESSTRSKQNVGQKSNAFKLDHPKLAHLFLVRWTQLLCHLYFKLAHLFVCIKLVPPHSHPYPLTNGKKSLQQGCVLCMTKVFLSQLDYVWIFICFMSNIEVK